METKTFNTDELSEKDKKVLEDFKDLFKAEKILHLNLPTTIDDRWLVGLEYLRIVLESIIAQISYEGVLRDIPVFRIEDRLPLSRGIDFFSREGIFDKKSKIVCEILVEHLMRIARASLADISNLLDQESNLRLKIDPEACLKTDVDWDIYVIYLQKSGFGIPGPTGTKYSGCSVTIGNIKEILSYRYSVELLDNSLSVYSNLIANRLILINMSDLRGSWNNADLLVSDYSRRCLNRPFAGQFYSKISEEIEPMHDLSDLLIDKSIHQDITSLCKSHLNSPSEALTFLLEGPSGVGKTTMAHGIAKLLGKKILRIHLNCKSEVLELYMRYYCEQARSQNFVLLFDEAEGLFRTSEREEATAGWARIIFQEFKGIAIFTSNYSAPYGFDRRMTYTVRFGNVTVEQKAILIKNTSVRNGYFLSTNEVKELSRFEVSPGYYENIFRLAISNDSTKSYESLKSAFLQRTSYLMSEKDLKKIQKKEAEPKKLIFGASMEEQLKPLNLGILRYRQDSSRFPKGVKAIFSGPPGVGKTALANQLSEQNGCSLRVITPSDIFGMYVGQSEKAVRRVFSEESSPDDTVLFLDEAEALFINRTYAQRTHELSLTNELLSRLDEYSGIVIAATNRYDLLDPAFKRRFLFNIEFSLPTIKERSEIWISKIPFLSSDILEEVSRFELTGADIHDIAFKVLNFFDGNTKHLVNECSIAVSSRHPKAKTISIV